MGMPQWTLCVRCRDAERPGLHSHAERGNDQFSEGEEICVMTSTNIKRGISHANAHPLRAGVFSHA
ncbi:hypothetical protein DMX04_14665 [Pseudomonas koreensis]|nr:hypothetical protein DMX04_14665 [Pseudomonas koreensis]